MTERMATRDAYGKALVELGQQDDRVVVLDADLSKSTKTALFGKAFPGRFFNMGIAEQNLMGVAAGLAAAGKIPFASTFAIFATGRAWEQVRNSIGYPHLNVKIAASHAGLTVGEDGASHQALEDLALMRAIPGMTVLVPADAVETRKMVMYARKVDGPVYLRLGRPEVPVILPDDGRPYDPRVRLLREGKDVAILAIGIMVAQALEAASVLGTLGIDAAVANVSCLKPLDVPGLVNLAECGAVVTAEEHTIIGGLGSAACEALAEARPGPVLRVGVRDAFGQSGAPGELLEAYGLTPRAIVEAAQRAVAMKSPHGQS
ncbi:MAG: transketolase C-terminal domain-containing protein [Bacillota bacterium]